MHGTGNQAILCLAPPGEPRNTRQTRAQDKIKTGLLDLVSPQKNTYIYRPLPFPPPQQDTEHTRLRRKVTQHHATLGQTRREALPRRGGPRKAPEPAWSPPDEAACEETLAEGCCRAVR